MQTVAQRRRNSAHTSRFSPSPRYSVSNAKDPELALYELEMNALRMADAAMEAFEESEGGMPPGNLIKALSTAHSMILARLKAKVGFSFDVNDLEGALLANERQKELILKLREQRQRAAALLS